MNKIERNGTKFDSNTLKVKCFYGLGTTQKVPAAKYTTQNIICKTYTCKGVGM